MAKSRNRIWSLMCRRLATERFRVTRRGRDGLIDLVLEMLSQAVNKIVYFTVHLNTDRRL